MLHHGAVVLGADLPLEVLTLATAGDENGGDDDQRGHRDDDENQNSRIHVVSYLSLVGSHSLLALGLVACLCVGGCRERIQYWRRSRRHG